MFAPSHDKNPVNVLITRSRFTKSRVSIAFHYVASPFHGNSPDNINNLNNKE